MELMITIVVIGILGAVAFPSFMGSIRKGRRAEAYAALSNVQQAQERFRANNTSYATTLASLSVPNTSSTGLYAISLANAGVPGYEAIATANTGTSQAGDTQCGKLGVKMENGNLTYAGTGTAGTLTYAATSPCWSR